MCFTQTHTHPAGLTSPFTHTELMMMTMMIDLVTLIHPRSKVRSGTRLIDCLDTHIHTHKGVVTLCEQNKPRGVVIIVSHRAKERKWVDHKSKWLNMRDLAGAGWGTGRGTFACNNNNNNKWMTPLACITVVIWNMIKVKPKRGNIRTEERKNEAVGCMFLVVGRWFRTGQVDLCISCVWTGGQG